MWRIPPAKNWNTAETRRRETETWPISILSSHFGLGLLWLKHMIQTCADWWFGCHFLFSHILGISSSQLTFIFFRGVAQPPTSVGFPWYKTMGFTTQMSMFCWSFWMIWGSRVALCCPLLATCSPKGPIHWKTTIWYQWWFVLFRGPIWKPGWRCADYYWLLLIMANHCRHCWICGCKWKPIDSCWQKEPSSCMH